MGLDGNWIRGTPIPCNLQLGLKLIEGGNPGFLHSGSISCCDNASKTGAMWVQQFVRCSDAKAPLAIVLQVEATKAHMIRQGYFKYIVHSFRSN